MRNTVGSAIGAAAICNDNGNPSARLNPHGMASAGTPPTLNGIVMLGELTSRSGWFGSAGSATLSAPAVNSASNRFSRLGLLAGQHGAPAQRLDVVFGADQGPRQYAVAQDPPE